MRTTLCNLPAKLEEEPSALVKVPWSHSEIAVYGMLYALTSPKEIMQVAAPLSKQAATFLHPFNRTVSK